VIKVALNRHRKVDSAAVVIVRPSDNRVLLLLRPSWISWAPNSWAFPGGAIEEGETSLAAATREVKEETSLDVTNLKKLNYPSERPVDIYHTTDYDGQVQIDWENDDWMWASIEEMSAYKLAPEVLDMYKQVLENE